MRSCCELDTSYFMNYNVNKNLVPSIKEYKEVLFEDHYNAIELKTGPKFGKSYCP